MVTGVQTCALPISLTVLAEDSRVLTLGPDTTPDGVVRVGSLRVSEDVDVHRPRQRDRLVGRLIEALRSGSLEEEDRRRRRRGRDEGAFLFFFLFFFLLRLTPYNKQREQA